MSLRDKAKQDYFNDFSNNCLKQDFIDNDFYKKLGVESKISRQDIKDKFNNWTEEYIRARFVYYLVHSGKFPKENIFVEFSIPKGNKNSAPLKIDICIFKKKVSEIDFTKITEIRQNILLVAETKKNEEQDLDKAITQQLFSAMRENESKDKVFGLYFDDKNYFLYKRIQNLQPTRYDERNKNYTINDDIPSYKDLLENINSANTPIKLKFEYLDAINENNFKDLLAMLNRAKDKLHPNKPVQDLIVEFLTLKVYDEKQTISDKNYKQRFYYDNDLEEFRKRMKLLKENAKKDYKNVLSAVIYNFEIPDKNDEEFILELVKIFQNKSILKANNESFNQIIFNNFGNDNKKAERGQFFTPIPLVETIIKMLNPQKNETLCDPCCGICDFLASAFRHNHSNEEKSLATNLYGFDIEKDNLKLAELNLVLNGDGGATLKVMDSFQQKYMENDNITEQQSIKGDKTNFNSKNYDKNWQHKLHPEYNLKQYDLIATNPPFGKGRDLKITDNNKNIIELYETYKVKKPEKENGKKAEVKSMDMGVLFLENTYRLTKEGGRFAIILSNSIASIKEWEECRKWLIDKVRIVALLDLPPNTFGETGVSTTVIFAYKPKQNEMSLLKNDYEVFVKEIENIGYEVKTKDRMVCFEPQYIIEEDTFEKTNKLKEDFTELLIDFNEFTKRQEQEIKNAFCSGEVK
ncbi:MAG: N-6 DNA methylase [Rickettsiales bacterium]|jgi:type I restriction enzyme M protein|nr:N-6 DNA methylase [Rickettsiales bacterium]